MFRKLIISVLIIFLIVMYGTAEIVFGEETTSSKKSILLLNSYNEGYRWTDDIVAAVEKRFNESNSNSSIEIDYLNSKHINDEQYFNKLYELYKYKYSERKYDVIIASDDDAYRFLTKYRDDLFPGVPVVFCGVNDLADDEVTAMENMTGIIEDMGFGEIVNTIRTIHPNIKQIYVINDQTTLGKVLAKDIMNAAEKYPSITFKIENSEYINDILVELTRLSNDSAVVLTPAFFKNDEGRFLSTAETISMITKLTELPVYSASDYFMDEGVIGSKVSDAGFHGDTAAKMALALLDGKSIDELQPIHYTDTKFVFDYNELISFGISRSKLPKGSRIINKSISSYNLPVSTIFGFVMLFICLLLFINMLLLINIKRRRKAEADLSYKEQVLRTLINGMPDVVYFKDVNGRWLEANQAAVSLMSLPESEYKWKTDKDIKLLTEGFDNPFADYENGSMQSDEMALSDKDGNKTIYNLTRVSVDNKGGNSHGIIIIARDITIRKNAVEALQQSEGILRATLNATADGILVTNLNKQILDCNQLFIKMWQLPRAIVEKRELEPLFDYGLGQIKNPERHMEWAARCTNHPQPSFNTMYLKNGKVFEVYSEVLTIQNSIQGRVWSFKDITERKRVETELQRSEERYRRLVELSPDAIYMEVDGRNVFTNAAGIELLGAAGEDEVYGRPILDFMSGDYKKSIKNYPAEQPADNQVFPLAQFKIKRLDDSFVDVEAATTTFDYNGETAVLSVVRDISERKEAEQLKISVEEKTKQLYEAWEYDKIKTEFFANISHELRTPINVILGAQKLFELFLKEVDLGNNQQKMVKYIKMMRQNCYRLTRLVNNLIDITRIDAGFFNISLRNYDIVNIIECVTLSVAEYVQDKGINLVFDTELEEKIIACDADKIERIMLNLLSNAVKFTNNGGTIAVYMKEEKKHIFISVSDTGIGIPEDKLKTVFERFVQVDKSFVRNCEGSGIGLSIVKSLIDLHGGSVELKSEVNKGTTFEIRLPIVTTVEEEIAASDASYQSSAERINVEFSDIYL
jgi:PAS domain S-box-containing protein